MPKYVLSLLVKPKLKNLLSDCHVLEVKGKINISLPSDINRWIKLSTCFDFWSIQKQEQDLIIRQKSSLSSNAWISSRNAQMLHFTLCRESLLGMPRIATEFEFNMVFCFGLDRGKKLDKKPSMAMIRNRYNRIPHPAPNTKWERDTNKQDNKTALKLELLEKLSLYRFCFAMCWGVGLS